MGKWGWFRRVVGAVGFVGGFVGFVAFDRAAEREILLEDFVKGKW